jgi:hypothetical protein
MAIKFDDLTAGSRLRIAVDGADMDVVVRDATKKWLDGNLGAKLTPCTLVFAHFGGGVGIDSPEVKQNMMRESSRHIERSMIGFLISEQGNAFFRVNDVLLL